MVRNTLGDLNNHLFAELERLNDEELTGEELEEEINRAKAMSVVATKVINNGELVLRAKMAFDDRMDADEKQPHMLEG